MKIGEIIGSIIETIIKIAIFIFLAMLIYRGALMAYDYGYRVFTEAPVSVGEGRIISVEVKSDMTAKELGEMLQQKGLIRDSKIFLLQEMLSEHHGDEVPGIYDLSTAMTSEEMLAIICADYEEVEEEEEIDVPKTEELYIPEEGTDTEGSETGTETPEGEAGTETPAAESEAPADGTETPAAE
ncbi:MAG: hypothetical protein K6G12_01440 [Lachnospiraceae bacterium]|nr:hypothetical protein [Lachnospiraceae bacterium]